jgi:ribosome-associated heat shock protein Hsp15
MPEKPDTRVRLDKWLYAARFYKTRSLAAQAIESGRARVDALRVKPSHTVRVGAEISVSKDALVWRVEVVGLSDKRGSASDAAKLYRESPEHTAHRELEIAKRKAEAASVPRTSGRPTKRDRRKIHSFFEQDS